MFAVLYRWRLKPASESTFREAWATATLAIRARYGTQGSRLHGTDTGDLIAYAVWPDRARWEEAQTLPSVAPEAAARMRECILESFEAGTRVRESCSLILEHRTG